MKKFLEKVLCIVCALVIVWGGLSYFEGFFVETPSKFNLITLVFDHNVYEKDGRYNDCGMIVTEDGHIWEYTNDTIADGAYVTVTFNARYTYFDITDDIIINVECE
jgi:hypothetical protein